MDLLISFFVFYLDLKRYLNWIVDKKSFFGTVTDKTHEFKQ